MADFMRIKHENSNLKQSGIANQLGYSSSTLQRYRNDINMLSLYRVQSNNTNKRTQTTSITNSDNNSHRDPHLKIPQMASNGLKGPQSTSIVKSLENKNKNVLKGGSKQEKIEIDEHYLDETLHKINS